jgi:pimeloyl-ACP methyl ester carboxylesterase
VRPAQRALLCTDIEAAYTPVVLVHGMFDNRSIFRPLRRALRRRGFARVTCVNLPLGGPDVETAAAYLARQIEDLCLDAGSRRVRIVAHSLGGLVARYYVQRMGGHRRVDTLVTLGTPHEPKRFGRRLLAQLRPNSTLLTDLAGHAAGCRTRFVAFSAERDAVIVPPESALIRNPTLTVRNVWVPGAGHHSLVFSRTVTRDIAATLAAAASSTRAPSMRAAA